MKKKLTSFALIAAMLMMLLPCGLMGTTAYAASAEEIVSYVNSKVGQSYPKGYCLAFVRQMFEDLGYGSSSSCCAYNYGSKFLDSTSRDNIPLGADVFFTGSSSICDYCGNHCGHIGIYVGDGNIVHAWDGKVTKSSIDYVVRCGYQYRGWGYHANIDPTPVTWDITKPDTYPAYPNDYFSINHNGTNTKYVTFIQTGLRELGYSLDVDGSFGYGTQAVVKKFQSDNGLESDGQFGPASWSKMVELLKKKYPSVVAPTSASISINKTSFTVGETVSFTFSGNNNAQFTIGIDKDGTRIVTKVCSSYSISSLEPGNYSAYVTAWNSAGHCDSTPVYFTVNPKPATVTSISFKSLPSKTSYYVGQKLNYSGLVVVAKYSDGSSKELTSGYTCTPAEGTTLTTQGSQLVQVKYENVLSSFYVNVNEVKLSSISIKSKPIKLTYTVGETLITSGLKLTATYNDGSTKEVTSGFTFTPSALNTAGTQKIIVTYEGKTTSFDVTVNPKVVDNNALKINVSSANAKPGDEVSVTISLADNPGFNYMKLKVKYDKNVMSLSSTESLNLLDGFSYIPGSNTASNPYVLSWGAAGDSKKNGNLVKLTFKISANAGEGEYPITLTCEDCSNQNDQDVKYQITSGKVSINNKIIGDVNGDGQINGKDATLLMKYLAEWDVTIDKSTSDVNKDGKINGKDATLLMKYLAEWDVTLG